MREIDIQLPKKFTDKFPEMKLEKAIKLHNKYLNTCRRFLCRALPHIEGDICNFPLKKAQDICGDFIYKNDRYYVWQEFFNIQPFFYVTKLGRKWSGMISEVRIHDQKYIELLIDTIDTNQLIDIYYSKLDISQRVNIPIDYDSLNAYISRTIHLLSNIDDTDPRYHKVIRNLRTAKYFKIITEYFYNQYGEYVIPHIINPDKTYGRTYYKGINLQNCSKEVRIATLGNHTSYDLNAAAYAIKLLLAKDIFDQYKCDFMGMFTYTKEYLDHKSKIRDILANVIHQYMPNHPNTLKLVKEAITAIGFGARMHEGSWEVDGIKKYSSLYHIIYNRQARIAFTKHEFIVNFLKEQDQLGRVIYEYYSRDENFLNKVKDIPALYNNNGKLQKNKVLSYLYQHMETLIMDHITKDIIPTLRIHDSFIMTKPLSSEEIKKVKYDLLNLSPYLTISIEDHNGWIPQSILDHEINHKKFIKQEELLANNGVMPKKFVKPYEHIIQTTDKKPYDGYDHGSQYDSYDVTRDDSVNNMSLIEKQNHYRIIGHTSNTLPNHIQKLIK